MREAIFYIIRFVLIHFFQFFDGLIGVMTGIIRKSFSCKESKRKRRWNAVRYEGSEKSYTER